MDMPANPIEKKYKLAFEVMIGNSSIGANNHELCNTLLELIDDMLQWLPHNRISAMEV